jgi:hypothetical protein
MNWLTIPTNRRPTPPGEILLREFLEPLRITQLMRLASLLTGSMLALVLALPASARADYAGEAQLKKLLPLLGTWTCSDSSGVNPALRKPEIWTVTQEGGWVVSTITGNNPGTNYKRFDLVLQKYIQVDIRLVGGASTSETGDSDPLNATWTRSNPFDYPSSYYDPSPEKETFSGNRLTLAGQYIHGAKAAAYEQACTKLRAGRPPRPA